jgi:hypothetical protein
MHIESDNVTRAARSRFALGVLLIAAFLAVFLGASHASSFLRLLW